MGNKRVLLAPFRILSLRGPKNSSTIQMLNIAFHKNGTFRGPVFFVLSRGYKRELLAPLDKGIKLALKLEICLLQCDIGAEPFALLFFDVQCAGQGASVGG